jgi:polysaccharide pyruvyl transferase CsaB
MQVVLCGYYGYGNGGDEALLATLLQFLPKNISPVVLSGNPADTQALHGVMACDRNNLLAVFNLLRSSQAFIWGGGSLIQDSTSALSPWYYCGLMLTARLLGLKTIAWAQGIGPLQRPQTQWIAKQAFQGCSAISVRDPGSADWDRDGCPRPRLGIGGRRTDGCSRRVAHTPHCSCAAFPPAADIRTAQ